MTATETVPQPAGAAKAADYATAILNMLEDLDDERSKVDQANLDLRAVNDAMASFVAVAAHDLRSPLASLVGFSALLTENWATLSEESRLKFVMTIDRQSQKLADLVNDLLTLSSIDGGGLHTQSEQVLLAEAIGQCLAAAGNPRSAAGIGPAAVTVSCAPELVVRVDVLHLERIIDNLLQNAFKYGEPPVRIEATPIDNQVEIRVVDAGPGVSPEFEPQLFGKFTRADDLRTRDKKGTGLGLSIVRGLAEANGGQARYQRNVPQGSCFIVLLPTDQEARR